MDNEPSLKQASDQELIDRSQQNRVAAFEELVRRYKRGVVAFVFSMVSDLETAREVAHDAFCAAYFSLDRLREPSQFSTWLFTIARNFALADRRERERHRRRFRSLEAAGENGEPTDYQALRSAEPTPEESSDSHEMHRRLAACISRLPGPLREVVNARYFDDLSCQEIASRMGTPIGTITKRLTRARRLLKDRLESDLRPEGRTS